MTYLAASGLGITIRLAPPGCMRNLKQVGQTDTCAGAAGRGLALLQVSGSLCLSASASALYVCVRDKYVCVRVRVCVGV